MQDVRSELCNIPINPKKFNTRKKEGVFQSQIFSHLRGLGWHCFHPPDLGLSTRLVDAVFTPLDGKIFVAELKQVSGYTFNMSEFQPSQIFYLEYCASVNAEAYVMVYSMKTNTYWVGTYSYLKANQNNRGGIKLF